MQTDFVNGLSSIVFVAGDARKCSQVQTFDDNAFEETETFQIVLTPASSNVEILFNRSSADILIADNDGMNTVFPRKDRALRIPAFFTVYIYYCSQLQWCYWDLLSPSRLYLRLLALCNCVWSCRVVNCSCQSGSEFKAVTSLLKVHNIRTHNDSRGISLLSACTLCLQLGPIILRCCNY